MSGLKSERGEKLQGTQKGVGRREECETTNTGINSTINLSVCFPSSNTSSPHLFLPLLLLSSTSADFTVVSNYLVLNISTQLHLALL